jgi:hypothetical protein
MNRRRLLGVLASLFAVLTLSQRTLIRQADASPISNIEFDQDKIIANLKDDDFFGQVLNDAAFTQRLRVELAPRGYENKGDFSTAARANLNRIAQDLVQGQVRLSKVVAMIDNGSLKKFHETLLSNFIKNSEQFYEFLKKAGIDPGGFVGIQLTVSLYYYGILNGLTFGNLKLGEFTFFWPFC